MAIPFAKSGYNVDPIGYVDNPIPKQCATCYHFKKPNLCNQEDVVGHPAMFIDPESGLALVNPIPGCCNHWEPAAMQPLNLVYVLRHGETQLNASNSFRGNVDVDIDAKGVKQAEEARAFLSGIPFKRFVASAKERSMHTMEIVIGDRHDFEAEPALMALNVGVFSGQKKTPETLDKFQYYIDHPDVAIPGGESLRDFQKRVRPVLQAAVVEATTEGKPILIVAHSSVVHEIGSMLHHDPESVLVEPGGVAVIYKLPRGKLDAKAILHPKVSHSPSDTVS